MNYIIDPSWFYWVQVLECFRIILLAFGSVAAAAAIFGAGFVIFNFEYGPSDGDYIMGKKMLKIFAPAAIVMLVAVILVPSKETMIEMQIANLATNENVNVTVKAIKNAVDYIINAAKSLK